ncbi:hypothetical protein JCM6882_000603 [Rhodosporidiobolus microsporus]
MSHQHMEEHILSVEGETVVERNADGDIVAEKSYQSVLHGLEGAAASKHTSHSKAKEDAEVAWELKQCHDGHHDLHPHITKPAHAVYEGDATHPNETHDETVHRHRQVGALRGQLKRKDVSDEAKERMREQLRGLGEEPEEAMGHSDEPTAAVAPFYGVSVLLRSILLACFAWRSSRGAFLFIFLLRHRPTRNDGSAVERLPDEVWDSISKALRDVEYVAVKHQPLGGRPWCEKCSRPVAKERGQLLGELWEDFEFDEKAEERCCEKCGEGLSALMGKTIQAPLREALPGIQAFLSLHCLALPTYLLRRNDSETFAGADQPFTTFLALEAYNDPPAAGQKGAWCGSKARGLSHRFVSEQTDDVFELDTRVPPAADETLMKFVRTWGIEVVGEEKREGTEEDEGKGKRKQLKGGALRLKGVEDGVPKQPGQPRWRIFVFTRSS